MFTLNNSIGRKNNFQRIKLFIKFFPEQEETVQKGSWINYLHEIRKKGIRLKSR